MSNYTYQPNPRLKAALAISEKAALALAQQTESFRAANNTLEAGLTLVPRTVRELR